MANNDLDELIRQSASEELETMERADAAPDEPFLRHPTAVVLAWLLCLMTALSFYANPLPRERFVGSRSTETDLSISMYHAAHRIETYRRFSGHLPDYLDPSWEESGNVLYELTDNGTSYVLTGRMGELEITFREGDNPEQLLHFEVFDEEAAR